MSHALRHTRHSPNHILVLSLFPGIDLLGRAFEEAGFCIVRGPDPITGGDIRAFQPPPERFDGIIGGPPCQDFSKLNRYPADYGQEMLEEYCRVVTAARPEWFLFENVVAVPEFRIEGYTQQRFALDLAWFSDFSRRRDFVFGSKSGRLLDPMTGIRRDVQGTCVIGKDDRPFRVCCDIQGLPGDFDLPFFTLGGKKQAVANGVPMPLGRYVAALIAREFYGDVPQLPQTAPERRRCLCGCGRAVLGKAFYASVSCRKRAQRAREKKVTPS